MGGKYWALQAGTSHNLGDHFGRVFDIRFLDRDGERKFAFNTSLGLSHRVVGATIMVHGDDAGLKLPPVVAPVQVVIVPIWRNDRRARARSKRRSTASRSGSARSRACASTGETIAPPGFKFNEWELKGVPLRLEIGPRDVAADQAVARPPRHPRKDSRPHRRHSRRRSRRCSPRSRRISSPPPSRCSHDHTAEVDSYDELADRVADERRLVARPLVRRRRVRSAGESRDQGDDPLHPTRSAVRARPMHRCSARPSPAASTSRSPSRWRTSFPRTTSTAIWRRSSTWASSASGRGSCMPSGAGPASTRWSSSSCSSSCSSRASAPSASSSRRPASTWPIAGTWATPWTRTCPTTPA